MSVARTHPPSAPPPCVESHSKGPRERAVARRQPSFFEVAWKRSKSATTAVSALRYVCEYGQACDAEDRALEMAEYAAHTGMARSHAFRRRDAFRKCFPKDDVLDVWAIFKPMLKGSNFAHEGSFGQAIYVGSLTFNPKART